MSQLLIYLISIWQKRLRTWRKPKECMQKKHFNSNHAPCFTVQTQHNCLVFYIAAHTTQSTRIIIARRTRTMTTASLQLLPPCCRATSSSTFPLLITWAPSISISVTLPLILLILLRKHWLWHVFYIMQEMCQSIIASCPLHCRRQPLAGPHSHCSHVVCIRLQLLLGLIPAHLPSLNN